MNLTKTSTLFQYVMIKTIGRIRQIQLWVHRIKSLSINLNDLSGLIHPIPSMECLPYTAIHGEHYSKVYYE